jgi:hypothetical protein
VSTNSASEVSEDAQAKARAFLAALGQAILAYQEARRAAINTSDEDLWENWAVDHELVLMVLKLAATFDLREWTLKLLAVCDEDGVADATDDVPEFWEGLAH